MFEIANPSIIVKDYIKNLKGGSAFINFVFPLLPSSLLAVLSIYPDSNFLQGLVFTVSVSLLPLPWILLGTYKAKGKMNAKRVLVNVFFLSLTGAAVIITALAMLLLGKAAAENTAVAFVLYYACTVYALAFLRFLGSLRLYEGGCLESRRDL